MVHDDLTDARSGAQGQRREEAVLLRVDRHALDQLTSERLQRAPGVVDPGPRHPADQPVGEDRRHAAQDQAVLAIASPAHDQVEPALQLRDQPRNVGGVVLEVRVHRDHHPAATRLEPGCHGGRLAEVAPQEHEAHVLGVLLTQPVQELPRAVGAHVVREDHLPRTPHPPHVLADLGVERLEVVALVEHGNHDRQLGLGPHGGGMVAVTWARPHSVHRPEASLHRTSRGFPGPQEGPQPPSAVLGLRMACPSSGR